MIFFENYRRYGDKPSTHDIIKFLAIFIMICDHIGHFFYPEALWWRAVGRIGFPVWFFLAGYAKPSKTNYEIVILAVLMILADIAANNPIFPVKALFSILACRWFVNYIDKHREKISYPYQLMLVLAAWYPVSGFLFQYGTLGFMYALCGYLVRHEGKMKPIAPSEHSDEKHHPEKTDISTSLKQKIGNSKNIIFIISYLSFIISQTAFMGYTIHQILFMTIGLGAVTFYLYDFKLMFFENKVPVINNPMKFFARNSMWVYFVHFVAFIFADYCLRNGIGIKDLFGIF